MKKLQKREKILLAVLLVIVVAVVPFVLFIFPAIQQNAEKESMLTELRAAQFDMETQLAAKPALESALAEMEENYEPGSALIPPVMKNYDIHYMISDICSKAGVTLDALSIGAYEAVESGAQDGQQQEQSAFLYHASLQFTVAGTFEQTMNVIDQLSERPYTVVTEFYIDMADPAQSSATSIRVELYAVSQPGDASLGEIAAQDMQNAEEAA